MTEQRADARRGYSAALARIVKEADQSRPEVQFARYCIENEVSAVRVAQAFGVTRATVYFWFKGVYKPRERHIAAMIDLLREAGVYRA